MRKNVIKNDVVDLVLRRTSRGSFTSSEVSCMRSFIDFMEELIQKGDVKITMNGLLCYFKVFFSKYYEMIQLYPDADFFKVGKDNISSLEEYAKVNRWDISSTLKDTGVYSAMVVYYLEYLHYLQLGSFIDDKDYRKRF